MMAAAKWIKSLQEHFVCQFKERWNQTDREILHHAARQRPKNSIKTTKEFLRGKSERFWTGQLISRLKTYWTFYMQKMRQKDKPLKTSTERGGGESWEMHHRSMQGLVMSLGHGLWCCHMPRNFEERPFVLFWVRYRFLTVSPCSFQMSESNLASVVSVINLSFAYSHEGWTIWTKFHISIFMPYISISIRYDMTTSLVKTKHFSEK